MDFSFLVQGSMIAPSDEDSFTFTVSAANGDIFKLRGKFIVHSLKSFSPES